MCSPDIHNFFFNLLASVYQVLGCKNLIRLLLIFEITFYNLSYVIYGYIGIAAYTSYYNSIMNNYCHDFSFKP